MSIDHRDEMRGCQTLPGILRWRATNQPGRTAFTFLPDGEIEEFHITYEALDRRARTIAAMLQREAGPTERALILCPPGLDYVSVFFGCLYAAVTAVPASPPDPASPDGISPRLCAIGFDAAPAVILTTNSVSAMATEIVAGQAPFANARWLAIDDLTGAEAAEWREPVINSDTLALLQYTAGSTAAPKGVMISHGNLMHSEALIQRALSVTEESICVSWLPLHHNMGLIGTVLQAVYTGFPCTLMSPGDFLRKPVRWLRAITRYRATLSGAPNFAYDLCINKVTPDQRAALDLRSWGVALNGAEPIQPETLEGFAAAFGPAGFRRTAFFCCYGLTEATWMVSGGPMEPPSACAAARSASTPTEQDGDLTAGVAHQAAPALVTSGRISPDQMLLIVDPETCKPCQDGEINEIWVGGPRVALGYRNMPQATDETFLAHLADSGDGPFLRTGDLGFVRDGELFVTARRQMTESDSGSQELVRPQDDDEPADQIVMALLDMEEAERLILLRMYLQEQVSRVLAVPASEVSESRPFMALGLSSLALLGLKGCIETDLGVVVPLRRFIDYPTIGQLARCVLDTLEESFEALLDEVGQLTDEEIDLRLGQVSVKEQ